MYLEGENAEITGSDKRFVSFPRQKNFVCLLRLIRIYTPMGTSISKLLGDSRELCAKLSLRLPDDHRCPLNETCPCVTDIERANLNGECHLITKADPYRDANGDVRYIKTEVDESCFCNVFTNYDSVAVILDKKEQELLIETYPPDRLTLMDLVSDLSEIGEVEVRQLSLVSGDDSICDFETVNVSLLTDLERETINWAIEHGYYERPRDIGLEEIADHFDVSKSSISQRLRSAERKLVVDAMEG